MNGEMQIVMSNKSDATYAFLSINSANEERVRATDAFLKEDVPDGQNRPRQVSSPMENTCKLNLVYQKPKEH